MPRTRRFQVAVFVAVFAVLAGGAYVGLRFLSRIAEMRFSMYTNTSDAEEARRLGALQATYISTCGLSGYASQLVRYEFGRLLQTRVLLGDAVYVVAQGVPDPTPDDVLVFEDGVRGLVFDDQDGRLEPYGWPREAGPEPDPNRHQCCYDYRARAPERFWLERGGVRTCAFTRVAGQRDASPPSGP